MNLQFRFSWKITAVCAVLTLLMLKASHWQWGRHVRKEAYVAVLESRLKEAVVPLDTILEAAQSDPAPFEFRRVRTSGRYLYDHEMAIRNRRHEDMPGSLVLTPFRIDGSEHTVIVSRGFVPFALADREKRKTIHRPPSDSFVGLLKLSSTRRFLAPKDDPAGAALPWVDLWLRADLAEMQKQLPYPILSFFLERIPDNEMEVLSQSIVSSSSGRDDIFYLAGKKSIPHAGGHAAPSEYPKPIYDTVVPPAKHLGYVFEWGIMALMTIIIGAILQLRRPTARQAPLATTSNDPL